MFIYPNQRLPVIALAGPGPSLTIMPASCWLGARLIETGYIFLYWHLVKRNPGAVKQVLKMSRLATIDWSDRSAP